MEGALNESFCTLPCVFGHSVLHLDRHSVRARPAAFRLPTFNQTAVAFAQSGDAGATLVLF